MKYTYINETDTIYEIDGELYLQSGDKTVVFNCEGLFSDLPFIITYVMKARDERTKMIKNEIKNQFKNKTL